MAETRFRARSSGRDLQKPLFEDLAPARAGASRPEHSAKGEEQMKIQKGQMIALGYGKYFRSDSVVGFGPIEEDRGPGRRAFVYIEDLAEPIVASRSEAALLRDMIQLPQEALKSNEQHQLLQDILDSVSEINPVLRSIIRDQGRWDLDRLEARLREVLSQD